MSASWGSVTCVVPTLNSARTLDMTLLSLHSQRNVHIDVRVVDSGSQDDTLEICRRWGFSTQYVPPGNMYRAINAGLRGATTEWLSYLNSDDWLYPESFARLIRTGLEQRAGIVYGHCDYVDEEGRFLYSFVPARPHRLRRLFRRRIMAFAQQGATFRGDCYLRLNGFDEQYRLSADADFFCRALATGTRFACVPTPEIACFRQHENQLTQKHAVEMEEEKLRIRLAMNEPAQFGDTLAVAEWKLRNARSYFFRWSRTT
jgi:glycosyltransferase involved in cell wall biosynthesis